MKLSTPSKKNKIIFLFGPTASGKTQLVEDFFSNGYEIINADSVQVYRHLDIGSAKPSLELLKKIKHYNVDILDPWEQFTVGEFVKRSDEAVTQIYESGNIPLVTGGTAFYFKHFLYGLAESPIADQGVRDKVKAMLDEKGVQELFKILKSVDPISAEKINVNDAYRITRALEVYYQTGRGISSFAIPSTPRNNMKPLIIGLDRDRNELYERIDKRVDIMFDEGLVDEIKKLCKMGASLAWPGIGGIGYREFFDAKISGEASIKIIKDNIKSASRHYAKRQLTFFKSFDNVVWIHPDDKDKLKTILDNYLYSE